jgi:hypothetical protein
MSDTMHTYKFESGLEVRGTLAQIIETASVLKQKLDFEKLKLTKADRPKGYYFSTSEKGMIKIESMHHLHIRRALNKLSKEYYEALSVGDKEMSIKEYIAKFVGLADDALVEELFARLVTLSAEEK